MFLLRTFFNRFDCSGLEFLNYFGRSNEMKFKTRYFSFRYERKVAKRIDGVKASLISLKIVRGLCLDRYAAIFGRYNEIRVTAEGIM